MNDPLGPTSAPDPFWAAVHRRHPDVDLVVLPPEPAVAVATNDADPDAVLERVAATAATLWSATVPESAVVPVVRWAFGPVPGVVRAEARAVERRGDGFSSLVTLRHELEATGWQVRRPDGPLERLVAEHGVLELAASCAEESGALLLVVSSSLAVGDRARELVRGGGR